ncbi:MAG: RES domain-containing protein [Rhizobiales bacterium]|nr:RES domain-containing protein [Hyphomicrobiales bacterium]
MNRFKGVVYRAHHPNWNFGPMSGDGAVHHGGRFSPVGLPALYASLRPETAWLEAQQGFPFKARSLVMCAYDVDCEGVLDLTTEAGQEAAGTSLKELACPWEDRREQGSATWRLSAGLRAKGCAAILVRSFAPGAEQFDVNIVFWRWSGDAPSNIRLSEKSLRQFRKIKIE